MGFEIWMSFVIMWVWLLGASSGYKFYVGGNDGWVMTPSENYTHWSHRNRFQVNDTLYFRYKKGSDSVLVVKEEDYDKCNTVKPISSLTDGDSLFVLWRSGPFYFVSGNSANCLRGQRLALVVLSDHHHPHHRSPSPSPSVSPPPVLPVPASSPGPNPSDSEPPAPAPAPMSALVSGSVRSVFSLFGLVLVVMIMSCMVL